MGHDRPNSQTRDHLDYVWPLPTRIRVYIASDPARYQPASCQDRYRSMSEPGQTFFSIVRPNDPFPSRQGTGWDWNASSLDTLGMHVTGLHHMTIFSTVIRGIPRCKRH